ELALEPNANPAAKVFQKAMFEQGIPLAAFETSDLKAEFARLKALGVAFTQAPTKRGPVIIAVLSDTCGNLLQLYQPACPGARAQVLNRFVRRPQGRRRKPRWRSRR